MKIKDITYGDEFNVWCQLNSNNIQHKEGSIKYIDNRLLFVGNNFNNEIEILDKSHKQSLDTNFARGYVNFAYIRHKKNNKYLVNIKFFAGKANDLMSDISISYDKYIIDSLKNKGIKEDNINRELFNECVIEVNNEKYIMVMNHFYAESNEENENNDIQRESIEDKESFVILGKSYKLYIQSKNIKDYQYYALNKIIDKKFNKQSEDMPILLKVSNITFKKEIEKVQPYLIRFFNEIIDNKGNNSYLKVWEYYTDIERKKALDKAKCILHCLESEDVNNNTIICTFNEPKYFDTIETGDIVVFVDKVPDYVKEIKDKSTIDELSKILVSIKSKQDEFKDNILYEVKGKIDYKHIEFDKKINKNQDVENKYAIILLKGEITQLERKVEAIKNIKEGKSANPMLRFLIEGGGDLLFNNRVGNKIKPISNSMKNKVFKNCEPTSNQLEAINIALNTPDIALIQGPPGTGKTTVINAILERLNEEYYQDGNINSGRVLVTAFQHDAVDNIVSKLKINAIPGIKFGGKQEDGYKISKELEYFCISISKNIEEKYKFKEDEQQESLNKLVIKYERQPTKNHALRLLTFMNDLDVLNFDTKLKHNIENQIEIFKRRKFKSESSFNLNTVYAIRLDEKSFADDGMKILSKLEKSQYLSEKDREHILKIKEKISRDIKNSIKDLQILKDELLDKYMPENEFRKNKINKNILNLVEKVKQILIDNAPIKDKKEKIVYNFKKEIDDNIESVIDSLKKYSIAFASTIQQSKGAEVVDYKDPLSKKFNYDVVIVDEVARSNPMDLFIVLEQAKNKIILVGDHRQLPHIVDEDIKEKLEQGIDTENYDKNLLKVSIFEYLLNNIKKLQQKDNIRRIITLNTQYRTHNILGDFINENFYKEYEESFTSPRQYSEFKIGITDIQKPCVWYNIKNGKEDKDVNGSRYNKSEINVIKNKLKEWMKHGEITESIGIISFYKSQVDMIKDSLREDESINYLIINNKLEIGTVDAFQGKEFDIIILSLVRCGSNNKKSNNEALFGHLMSKNRLCVAMSRAKRALIIVGNIDFMSSEKAKEAVPALYNYAKLCETKDGEIINV